MKWFKRLLLLTALCLVVLLGASLASYWMLTAEPEWFKPRVLTVQQQATAARSAEDKLLEMRNWAAEATTRPASTSTSAQASDALKKEAGHFTLTLNQDELDSFFQKWHHIWQSKTDVFVREPHLILNGSRLIIAGKLNDRNIVASMHFEPKIDSQGHLDMNLVQILGGKLPLPEELMSKPRRTLIARMQKSMPEWLRTANLDRNGTCNAAMTGAGLGKLVLATLQHESADNILYVPVDEKSSMPVKLVGVKIIDDVMTIDAQILTPEDRRELVKRMKTAARPTVHASLP